MTSDENNSICDCAEHLRAECRTERFITNAEGERYCLWHYPGTDKPKPVNSDDEFICGCEEYSRSACKTELFFKSYEGNDYCVLHYPGTDKVESFRTALRKKLVGEDFDFGGVWFPEAADFRNVRFSEDTNFFGASFSAPANFFGASFSEEANSFVVVAFCNVCFSAGADFSGTIFGGYANFSGTRFLDVANFFHAKFKVGGDFTFATFNATAVFDNADFPDAANFFGTIFKGNAEFRLASFGEYADFQYACFKDYVRFSGSKKSNAFGERPHLNLQFAQFEKPERVSFNTLTLRQNWFINVDARKFEFVDVDWDYRLKEELKSAIDGEVTAPYRLLASAYRQLADNAETNHRYLEASRFRYNAFEVRRIEKFRGFVPWRLDWWYWLASGYGESVGRAALVFIALLVLFTVGYKRSEFMPAAVTATPSASVMAQGALQPAAPEPAPKRLGWREAALYSFNVSLLQKPEPKPKGLWSSFLVALQTVLGPAQAALLALAVRRRFMR